MLSLGCGWWPPGRWGGGTGRAVERGYQLTGHAPRSVSAVSRSRSSPFDSVAESAASAMMCRNAERVALSCSTVAMSWSKKVGRSLVGSLLAVMFSPVVILWCVGGRPAAGSMTGARLHRRPAGFQGAPICTSQSGHGPIWAGLLITRWWPQSPT
jgi:hypothetical protein